ncbi:bifunctional lysylphosphatidylglycerol synthetase/lysine--tRNA ligase LysX [Luteipulveratus flavus]|uniref:Lysine--tRNA ligase n=1 Tax=Luteipulveratus flavus TaxID=3031728 RepID=A0ABT6CB21_9MICO|nr:bifunctional lysylphosphatidylglycerol synthetase/lysine--tRNA ligase LysX [Luteipulveratus sp. YIM 133296]MDF8266090.1 bifunctional lysylphosphatidylglycerol synthetase/lysine--tRNA ligase LysX [Luteipulveratus sp. YIM 133296]
MMQALKGSFRPYGGGSADRTRAPRDPRERVAIWLGRVLLLAAVWALISLLFKHRGIPTVIVDVFEMLNVPAEPSLFVVALLLALSGAVRRRFRVAHVVTVVVMALSIAEQIRWIAKVAHHPGFPGNPYHGFARVWWDWRNELPLNILALAAGLVVLGLVVWSYPAFTARLAPGARRAAIAVLAAGLVLSAAVTTALTFLLPRTLNGPVEKVAWSVRSTFGISTPPDEPGFHGHLGHHWIYQVAGVISAGALVLAILVFWRAGRAAQHQDADEELAVRRLLLEHGEGDSLGYFATRRDKSVVFSPDQRAAVTYRVEGSVSVASADPIGRRSSWDAAIQVWLAECRLHGWYAAVLSSSEEGTREYVAAGLRAFALGDEAIIEIDRFRLRGRSMRPVRQAVTRISRAGYTTRIRHHADLSPAELAEIGELAEQWRGEEIERGFSMALNRLGDPADGRCVLITAHDRDGQIRGFLSFVPWGSRGLSLDLMRRDRAAENGLNEYLVSQLVDGAGAIGVRRISLNFAVFRNVFSSADQVGAGPVTKATDAFLSFVSRFYQLETLYRSNDKYQPQWVPRLLCYDPALTVARAGIAMGVAEGFLPLVGPRFLVGPRVSDTQPPRPEPDFVDRVRAQEAQLLSPAAPIATLTEQQRVRRDKLTRWEKDGEDGYPVGVPRTHRVAEIRCAHAGLGTDVRTENVVSVAGRVRALRDLGGVTFAVLEDEGERIQVMATSAETPARPREQWRRMVDLGDIVSVTGSVATSRTGELSVLLQDWDLAGKCLSPVPDLRATLADDVRVRQRALDLIVTPDSVDMLRRRSAGVRAMREAFGSRDFTEVETPILQAVHGGAAARPFRTHINAYDMDLYLRIAPELYLKRLCIGGMQRVFELGRNFRNEGVDATHNPEFTSLEAYQAYADYDVMRELTRDVLLEVATAVNGRPVARRPDGDVDLSPDWPVITVHDAVGRATGVPLTSSSSREEVAEVCRAHDVSVAPAASAGQLVVELYEALVEKQTTFPTFYTDFPLDTSPLTRRHRDDPNLAERWDLVAFGAEIGTAYSELTDPVDQRRRLTAQSMAAAAGDPEAMQLDESFLAALEYAMPPTGGLGLGVDRAVMMLTGASIRATLAFPFVRPNS